MQNVLRGITVLEVAQWWFAPSAAAILKDWGAEIIKIEHPVRGDPQRGLVTSGALPGTNDINYMVEQSNRGKRSIGLDISSQRGREVLDWLIDGSDVFLTNFLPSARRRYQLEADDVWQRNPRIVYGRGHATGDRGPERERGGFDSAIFWARGGVAHRLSGPDAPAPVQQRPSFGDGTAALAMAGAIAAALFGRERHREPALVDVSLLSSAMWVLSPDIVAADVIPGGLPDMSREQLSNPLSNCYPTADGRWLWLAMLQSDRHWPELCQHIGRPDLIDDERFTSAAKRATNVKECMAELEDAFSRHTLDEWRRILADIEGVWAPVQTVPELQDDVQVKANGYLSEVDYGHVSRRLVPNPAQFDEQPPDLGPAPEVGQHTEEILLELGSNWDEIIELKETGAIN